MAKALPRTNPSTGNDALQAEPFPFGLSLHLRTLTPVLRPLSSCSTLILDVTSVATSDTRRLFLRLLNRNCSQASVLRPIHLQNHELYFQIPVLIPTSQSERQQTASPSSMLNPAPIPNAQFTPIRFSLRDPALPFFVYDAVVLNMAHFVTSGPARYPKVNLKFLLGTQLDLSIDTSPIPNDLKYDNFNVDVNLNLNLNFDLTLNDAHVDVDLSFNFKSDHSNIIKNKHSLHIDDDDDVAGSSSSAFHSKPLCLRGHRLKSKDMFEQPIIPTEKGNASDDKFMLPPLQLKVFGSSDSAQNLYRYPSNRTITNQCTNGNLTSGTTNRSKSVSGKAVKESVMNKDRVHYNRNGEWFYALGRQPKQKDVDNDRIDLDGTISETYTLPIDKLRDCGFHSTWAGLQNEKMTSKLGHDIYHDGEATLHRTAHNTDHQTEVEVTVDVVDPAVSNNLKRHGLEKKPTVVVNIPEHVGENISTKHSMHHSQLPSSYDTIHDSAQQLPGWDQCSTSNVSAPPNDVPDSNRNQQENQKTIVNASNVGKGLTTAFCSNSCQTFSVSLDTKPIETETEKCNEPYQKAFHNMEAVYSTDQGKDVIESTETNRNSIETCKSLDKEPGLQKMVEEKAQSDSRDNTKDEVTMKNTNYSLYSPGIIQRKEGNPRTQKNMETLLQDEEKLIENDDRFVTSVSTGIVSSTSSSLETNKMVDILSNRSESLNQSKLPSFDNRKLHKHERKINCSMDTDETTMHATEECLRQTIRSKDPASGEGIAYRETHESVLRARDVQTSSLSSPVSDSGEVENNSRFESPLPCSPSPPVITLKKTDYIVYPYDFLSISSWDSGIGSRSCGEDHIPNFKCFDCSNHGRNSDTIAEVGHLDSFPIHADHRHGTYDQQHECDYYHDQADGDFDGNYCHNHENDHDHHDHQENVPNFGYKEIHDQASGKGLAINHSRQDEGKSMKVIERRVGFMESSGETELLSERQKAHQSENSNNVASSTSSKPNAFGTNNNEVDSDDAADGNDFDQDSASDSTDGGSTNSINSSTSGSSFTGSQLAFLRFDSSSSDEFESRGSEIAKKMRERVRGPDQSALPESTSVYESNDKPEPVAEFSSSSEDEMDDLGTATVRRLREGIVPNAVKASEPDDDKQKAHGKKGKKKANMGASFFTRTPFEEEDEMLSQGAAIALKLREHSFPSCSNDKDQGRSDLSSPSSKERSSNDESASSEQCRSPKSNSCGKSKSCGADESISRKDNWISDMKHAKSEPISPPQQAQIPGAKHHDHSLTDRSKSRKVLNDLVGRKACKGPKPLPNLTNRRDDCLYGSVYNGGHFEETPIKMDLPTRHTLTFWMIGSPDDERELAQSEEHVITVGRSRFTAKGDQDILVYGKLFSVDDPKSLHLLPARTGMISPLQKTVMTMTKENGRSSDKATDLHKTRLPIPTIPPDYVDLGAPEALHVSLSRKLIGLAERSARFMEDADFDFDDEDDRDETIDFANEEIQDEGSDQIEIRREKIPNDIMGMTIFGEGEDDHDLKRLPLDNVNFQGEDAGVWEGITVKRRCAANYYSSRVMRSSKSNLFDAEANGENTGTDGGEFNEEDKSDIIQAKGKTHLGKIDENSKGKDLGDNSDQPVEMAWGDPKTDGEHEPSDAIDDIQDNDQDETCLDRNPQGIENIEKGKSPKTLQCDSKQAFVEDKEGTMEGKRWELAARNSSELDKCEDNIERKEGDAGGDTTSHLDNSGVVYESGDEPHSTCKSRRYYSHQSSGSSSDNWREESVKKEVDGRLRPSQRRSYDNVVNAAISDVVHNFRPNRYVAGVSLQSKETIECRRRTERLDSESDTSSSSEQFEGSHETPWNYEVTKQPPVAKKMPLCPDTALENAGVHHEKVRTEDELMYIVSKLQGEKEALEASMDERDEMIANLLRERAAAQEQSGERTRERDARDKYIGELAKELQSERARREALASENKRLLGVIRRLADELLYVTSYADVGRVVKEAKLAVEMERNERIRLEKVVKDFQSRGGDRSWWSKR